MKTQKVTPYQPQGHTESGSVTVPFWMGWLRGNGKQIKPPPPRKLTPEPKIKITSR